MNFFNNTDEKDKYPLPCMEHEVFANTKKISSMLFHEENYIHVCKFQTGGKYTLCLKTLKQSSIHIILSIHTQEDIDLDLQVDIRESGSVFLAVQASNIGNFSGKIQSTLQKGGSLYSGAFFQGNKNNNLKLDWKNNLQGESSKSLNAFVYIGKDSSKSNFSIENESQTSKTHGEIWERVILHDNAQCFLEGTPIIQPGAKQCISHLEQKSLLFGEKSFIRTAPCLLISNNDVDASHSSSISTFSPEDIFYLQSRGLSHKSAQELIIEAFIQEVFQQASVDSLL